MPFYLARLHFSFRKGIYYSTIYIPYLSAGQEKEEEEKENWDWNQR
jgi:hypothetical protein